MNKKICILLALITALGLFALTGCRSKEEIMTEYTEILAKNPETDSEFEEMLDEAEDYMDSNISKVGFENADYMLYLYVNTAKVVVEEDEDKLESLIDSYGMYLSDMMREFMNIELSEIKEPLADISDGGDAGAFYREAFSRAIALEAFVKEYEETLNSKAYDYFKSTVTWQYEYYINYVLLGTTGVRMFDSASLEFSSEAKDIYTELAQKNPDTASAWAVNEYFTYLGSIDYKLDYNNADDAKIYYDTCSHITSEAGKKLYEQEAETV